MWYRSSDNRNGFELTYDTGIVLRVEALYVASILSNEDAQSRPVDMSGHIRIPMLELLDQSKADRDGWIPSTTNGTEERPIWSSLIGIPI